MVFIYLYIYIIWFYIFSVRDRFRTMINVEGDSIGAGIVNKLSQDDLAKQDEEELNLTKLEGVSDGKVNKAYQATEEKYETLGDPDIEIISKM